jgi:flagellar hook-associated protein 2
VQRDNAKITGSVQQFIGVYNELKKTTTDLRTKVLAEERGSLLNLEAQFRAILSSAGGTSTEFSRLAEIGVITKLDGSLELKTTVFEAALNADPAGMADLFSNPSNGLAVRLDALASGLLEAGGMLDSREQGLKARIDDTRDARTNLEFRLGRKEAALVDQFSALDSLLAQLNATSNYLATQLTILTPSRS